MNRTWGFIFLAWLFALFVSNIVLGQDRTFTWRFVGDRKPNTVATLAEYRQAVRLGMEGVNRYFTTRLVEKQDGRCSFYVAVLDPHWSWPSWYRRSAWFGRNWPWPGHPTIGIGPEIKPASVSSNARTIIHELTHFFGSPSHPGGHNFLSGIRNGASTWAEADLIWLEARGFRYKPEWSRSKVLADKEAPWMEDIINPNEPPVVRDEVANVNWGSPKEFHPLDNDFDPEGEPITLKLATSDDGELEIFDSNTKIRFTPSGRMTPVIIDYTVTDGELDATGKITATIKNLPWQNPDNRFDVDRGGSVTSRDALLVMNAIRSGVRVNRSQVPDSFYDVNGDGRLTSLDALQVLNHIRENQ